MLEGKLGQLLTVSWHVRGQIGAKMGKLTLLGGLRGTKLEIKGALGATKKASRGPQRAMTRFGKAAGGLIFWPWGCPK